MRSYPVKKNHIGLAVGEILWYKQTDRYPVLYYKDCITQHGIDGKLLGVLNIPEDAWCSLLGLSLLSIRFSLCSLLSYLCSPLGCLSALYQVISALYQVVSMLSSGSLYALYQVLSMLSIRFSLCSLLGCLSALYQVLSMLSIRFSLCFLFGYSLFSIRFSLYSLILSLFLIVLFSMELMESPLEC